jgi:hypothetical protein
MLVFGLHACDIVCQQQVQLVFNQPVGAGGDEKWVAMSVASLPIASLLVVLWRCCSVASSMPSQTVEHHMQANDDEVRRLLPTHNRTRDALMQECGVVAMHAIGKAIQA